MESNRDIYIEIEKKMGSSESTENVVSKSLVDALDGQDVYDIHRCREIMSVFFVAQEFSNR